ncbi:MAG TPA: citrate synthase [Solirubrobacterales bacterium]|nr:citrate synthase [Solirubrobacterales bacterium]
MSDAVDRLGTEEVARRLGVKRETVYAYVSRGLLRRHPASGPHDSRFDPEEVERLAARARRPDRSSALEVVVESELTLLDPAGHLSYRGRDAIELARYRSFEEVVALLWDGAPPAPWVLDEGRAEAIEALGTALGPEAPDAERIAAVVATLAARDPDRDSRDPESVRRAGAASFAAILAALAPAPVRGRPFRPPPDCGRPDPPLAPARTTPRASGGAGGVAERLWAALAAGEGKARPEEVAALDAALILLADHDLAASTFAARVAASAWAGPYRVILAGLGPLGGALHGGAGTAVESLIDEVAAGADAGEALDARLASGPVPGFGHRVYRDRDPRADHLLARLAPERGRPSLHAPDRGRPPLRMGLPRSPTSGRVLLRSPALGAAGALLDAAAERDLPAPNVDFALAALVRAHGLRAGASATIFTIARIAGIVAHALEEYEHRLRFRPRASYVGPAPPSIP